MTSPIRRARAGAVVLAGCLALGACSGSLPEPAPEAAQAVAPPVLTAAQSETVLERLGEVLGQADAALDPALLAERVSGPALAMRGAEYVRASATAGAKLPTALPVITPPPTRSTRSCPTSTRATRPASRRPTRSTSTTSS